MTEFFLTLSGSFATAALLSIILGLALTLALWLIQRLNGGIQQQRSFWFIALLLCFLVFFAQFFPTTLLTQSMPAFPSDRLALIYSQSPLPSTPGGILDEYEIILPKMLARIYLAGLLIGLIRFAANAYCLSGVIKRARPVDEQLAQQFAELTRTFPCKKMRGIKLKVSDEAHSPFAVSIPCQTIVLTRPCLERMNPEQLQLVLLHELHHLQKLDPLITGLARLISVTLWFNPFAHYFLGGLKLATELNCDNHVLHSPGASRGAYAASFQILLSQSLSTKPLLSSTAGSEFIHGQKWHIRQRILNLQRPARPVNSLGEKLIASAFFIIYSYIATLMHGSAVISISKNLLPPLFDIDRISSAFGERVDPISGQRAFHGGIDLPSPQGTKVLATASGEIEFVEPYDRTGYGLNIVIQHAGNKKSRYANLASINVREGEFVRRGQVIGTVGSSGNSTGPHLHFEIMKNNIHQDPALFIDLLAKNE